MAQLQNIDHIKEPLRPILSDLLDETIGAASGAGAKLHSAVLYGSAATRQYQHGRSDVNVYMVFDTVNIDLLKALRGVFRKHFKKLKANPVVLDDEYFKGSTDVFPMEFLEWQEKSIVFHGGDLLRDLNISLENLRLSIELNLRGKRMRLIQSYFEFDPRKGRFMQFLLSTLPDFTVACRNLLRLMDAAVTADVADMLSTLERKSDVELKTLKRLVQMKQDNMKVGASEADILFKQFLAELDRLIAFVDSFNAQES